LKSSYESLLKEEELARAAEGYSEYEILRKQEEARRM
jgi:hypothetical protein